MSKDTPNTHQTTHIFQLFKEGKVLTFNKGEVIIRPDDPPGGVYLVNSGVVVLYSITRYGEVNQHGLFTSGSIFPLTWALGLEYREAYYGALQSCELQRIERKTFLKRYQTSRDAQLLVTDQLVDQSNALQERVEALQLRNARQKIIRYLSNLNEHFGSPQEEGSIITLPVRHSDIANSVGISSETASRELAALARKGLIGRHQHHIVLKKPAALKKQIYPRP